MKSRGHQGKSFLLLLFVIIFAFWWGISVLAQNNIATPATSNNMLPAASAAIPQNENISGPVALQVIQKGNEYTYSGSLLLPSSCDDLGTGIAVNGANPAHVTVLLTVTKPLVACAEASGATDGPFSVSVSVKPGTQAAFDGLTINGIIVATNIQKAPTK